MFRKIRNAILGKWEWAALIDGNWEVDVVDAWGPLEGKLRKVTKSVSWVLFVNQFGDRMIRGYGYDPWDHVLYKTVLKPWLDGGPQQPVEKYITYFNNKVMRKTNEPDAV
jgi:hypothetical protein